MNAADREYLSRACAMTYVAAVLTSAVVSPRNPPSQHIEQQVIVMPEATTKQVDDGLKKRIEEVASAVSYTGRP